MTEAARRPILSRKDYDAVLFDLDGVITDTASVHATAWKALFDEYLKRRAEISGEPFVEFDLEADYALHVDGRPRYEGVQTFLKSRGIDLPFGEPGDDPEAETCCGLGNKKNLHFTKILERDGADVFRTSVDLLHKLRAAGFKTAVVSSSKNCLLVINSVGIANLFDMRIDGAIAEAEGIKGKPEPDTYLEAASRLGVPANRAVVFEDAVSGVQAGAKGKFGLVVGVDRVGEPQQLLDNGADVVIRDAKDITVGSPIAETPITETGVTEPRKSMSRSIQDLPDAFEAMNDLNARLSGKTPAVFLDYDGTLTPIVDRPDMAILSDANRTAVHDLSERCPVCIVSGRDRPDVQKLVAIDTLIYAGSHGFDIEGPGGQNIQRDVGAEFGPVMDEVTQRLHAELDDLEGAIIEPKKASVAAHYRMVAPEHQHRVKDVVDAILAAHDNLKITPGKMVFELQPKIDWNKGKAVLYLLEALGLDRDDVVPMYFGDDHTDEHAFEALAGRGIGVFVGTADDPEVAGRTTLADYRVDDTQAAGRFLDRLAR